MRSTSIRPLSRPLLAAAVALLAAASGAAHATTYTAFSDAAAFAAAAPGLETYGFAAGDDVLEPRPYVVGPLGFSSTQHFTHPYLEDDGAYGAGQTYLALKGVNGVNAASDPQVAGVYAIAFDLGTLDGADSVTVKLNFTDTVETIKTGPSGTSTFVGIISSDPIQQISFTAKSGHEIDLLDFTTVATVSAVPEPAALPMALAGLGLFGALARRRKSRRA